MKKAMSRREFVGAFGALAGMVALAGCGTTGGNTGGNKAASSSAAASSEAAATSSDLKLLQPGVLTVGTSPDFPPFENMQDGSYVGLDMELSQKIAEKLGLTVEYKNLQFDAIIPAVSEGGQVDVGMSGITIDPDRQKQVDFTSSYYTDDQCIVTMKSNADVTSSDQSKLNAAGVVIAVQSGTSGESYAKENFPNATTQPYGNATDSFAALQAGQAVAVITNKAVGTQMVASAYADAHVVQEIATGEEYAIAVSKDNVTLRDAINTALKSFEDDGTLKNLYAKYLR